MLHTPRTDPGVRDSRTGLLSRVGGGANRGLGDPCRGTAGPGGAGDTKARHCVRTVLCRQVSPRPGAFPPPPPLPTARLCSEVSTVLRTCPTSHGRTSSATAPCLPDAGHTAQPVVSHEISRFPRKERPHMPGSKTARGRRATRDDAAHHVAFRCLDGVGTPKETFVAQWLACAIPCQRFATPSRVVDA